ncbi:hypothetical protein GCM10027443_06360 [Pontibacter brevis]
MAKISQNQFAGKVALVTGASSGIGRATALQYAREGAKVIVSDIQHPKGMEVVEEIKQNGGGAIINNSSILGQVSFANASAYVASKHGVVGLTKTAALEYSTKGIRFNAVGPAFIKTPLLAEAGINDDAQQMLAGLHPTGRWENLKKWPNWLYG